MSELSDPTESSGNFLKKYFIIRLIQVKSSVAGLDLSFTFFRFLFSQVTYYLNQKLKLQKKFVIRRKVSVYGVRL